jgi:hypothetical protein
MNLDQAEAYIANFATKQPEPGKVSMDLAQAEAFIATLANARQPETSKVSVFSNFEATLLDRIDADARRLGINRTAWLHVAANYMLRNR